MIEANKKSEIERIIIQIDSRLNQVEVKGDSVEHLLSSRMLLKKMLEILQSIEEKEETKKEE